MLSVCSSPRTGLGAPARGHAGCPGEARRRTHHCLSCLNKKPVELSNKIYSHLSLWGVFPPLPLPHTLHEGASLSSEKAVIIGSLIRSWVNVQTGLTRLLGQAVRARTEPPPLQAGFASGTEGPVGAGPPLLAPSLSLSLDTPTARLCLWLSHSKASQWGHLPDYPCESVPGLDAWAEPQP